MSLGWPMSASGCYKDQLFFHISAQSAFVSGGGSCFVSQLRVLENVYLNRTVSSGQMTLYHCTKHSFPSVGT